MENVDLIVAGGTVITQNARREIIPNGVVVVRGDTLLAVLPAREAEGRYTAQRTLDARGRFVFPGLINTHTHLFQTFTKGLGEGLPLYEWVDSVPAPVAAAMTEQESHLSALLGGLEALHSGTTTVLDFAYSLPTPHLYRGAGRAFRDLGLRGILARGLMDTGEQHGLSPCQFHPVDEALAEWDGLAGELSSSLVALAVAPEVPFGVSRAGLERLRTYAVQRDMLITMHVNEGSDDDRAVLADHGRRAIPFLEEIGFWGPDVLAVHCVRMQPEDIEILARHDVKVSHNPVSNMYLGIGTAPIVEMRRAGLAVGLGTDGAGSNNSQDMLETLKCAGLIHKLAHGDPTAMRAADVLDMATLEGARAIGQGGRLGSLEPGKQADLFVLDPLTPKAAPVLDPVASLVYSCGEDSVHTVIVAGRVVLDEGVVVAVDERAVLQECQAAASRLAERCGLAWRRDPGRER
jgi:5-methylthioadenosine/S-adenosylhomocysteine deaminase